MVLTTAAASVQSNAAPPPIDEWIERFHTDGFLIVRDVLSAEHIARLRADLDSVLGDDAHPNAQAELQLRMFESSQANLDLFDIEPIATFAERLIGDDRGPDGAEGVHVMHNNAFRTRNGQGISGWHSDEPPYYLVTDGEPPRNVRLPVLLFTCNFYLTDVTEPEHGPTQFVPGSHLFGQQCPVDLESSDYADQVVSAYGTAGTAIMFSCQTWHRGSPNASDRVRYVSQISYGSRIIGHRFHPFMNYVMPEHVYADASPRLKRLLGFVPAGAYG